MNTHLKFTRLIWAISATCAFLGSARAGDAQNITVTKARIGCLDIQPDGNLTGIVASACNNKSSCSYQAPTPQQYTSEGVHAATRTFCTQAMDITYRCGPSEFHTVTVPGDAWKQPPAQLTCTPAAAPAHVPKPNAITVSQARIGCLDIQTAGNLTGLVGQACDDKSSCSYKAPTPQEYAAAGITANTRAFLHPGDGNHLPVRAQRFSNCAGSGRRMDASSRAVVVQRPAPTGECVRCRSWSCNGDEGTHRMPRHPDRWKSHRPCRAGLQQPWLLFIPGTDTGCLRPRRRAGAHETVVQSSDGDYLPMRPQRRSDGHCSW